MQHRDTGHGLELPEEVAVFHGQMGSPACSGRPGIVDQDLVSGRVPADPRQDHAMGPTLCMAWATPTARSGLSALFILLISASTPGWPTSPPASVVACTRPRWKDTIIRAQAYQHVRLESAESGERCNRRTRLPSYGTYCRICTFHQGQSWP